MDYKSRLAEYKHMIEDALASRVKPCGMNFDRLLEAMQYSLMAGGKRIRPMLVLEFCRACGGDINEALPAACAIEMLHTYTLIHDDLPCMDNDELRRGKPTNHMVFGEWTATLAGDALQAEAFGTILRSRLTAKKKAACAEILADAAGVDGICGGQYLDISLEGQILSEEQLTDIHARKTAALLNAACRMGVVIAGGGKKQLDAAAQYGATIGLAFQIRDDMLDVLSNAETLGKPIGSDKNEGKTTFIDIFGEETCRGMIERLTNSAKKTVLESFSEAEFLCELADGLAERQN